jgi:ribosomal protein S27AE
MQRFGIGLAYHQNQRSVTCCQCGATWEERFVGVSYFNSDGRKTDAESHLCPRCIAAPLTVEFVMEQEIALAVSASQAADPEQVRKDTIARYEQFLASPGPSRNAG